jgi:FKBP-type peptidyl-prolyl cis-trans isomerase FkpA/FKBP-type peptidyl-prolyl cis-trans isomerase FklB
MKTNKLFVAAAVALSMIACNGRKPAGANDGKDSTAVAQNTEKIMSAKDFLPSKGERDSVSYLIGINFGSFIKGYNFGSDLNYAQIKKGMRDFINAKGNQNDTNFLKQFKINPEEMNRLFSAYIEKRNQYTAEVNKEKEVRFLSANKAKAGVQTTASGLQYIIQEAGNDVKPGPRDTVFVHYKGTLTDGTVFDEVPETASAIQLTLDRVIPGWTEGLGLIGEGGKATLYIPSELGYGSRGTNGIEPNSPLIFDIQLDSVKRFVEPVEEPATK